MQGAYNVQFTFYTSTTPHHHIHEITFKGLCNAAMYVCVRIIAIIFRHIRCTSEKLRNYEIRLVFPPMKLSLCAFSSRFWYFEKETSAVSTPIFLLSLSLSLKWLDLAMLPRTLTYTHTTHAYVVSLSIKITSVLRSHEAVAVSQIKKAIGQVA